MIDMNELASVIDGRNVLLIHHWDADGIASAAILMEELKRMGASSIENEVPKLGEFEMDEGWILKRGNHPPDILVTTDICIPLDNLLAIRDGLSIEIVMFDHHARVPVDEKGIYFINYCSLRDEDWPSNTLVLNDFFGREPDLLSALGLVGDKGLNITKYGDVWPGFHERLRAGGFDLHDLMKLVDLLDSCYKSGRRTELMELPWSLVGKNDEEVAETITGNGSLAAYTEDIEKKISDLFGEGLQEADGFHLKEIDTEYHVISALTRKFSNAYPEREIMVTNTGIFSGKTQLYFRSKRKDVRPLISMIHDLGQSAGGKTDVVGAVIDNGKLEIVMDRISRELPTLTNV